LQRIDIKTEQRSYEAIIEPGVLRSAGAILRDKIPSAKKAFGVSVAKVRRLHGAAVAESMKAAELDYHIVEMPDGERYKRLATVDDLAEKLVKAGADRSSVIVALGGGVVGDVAGFLASVYMRGVPCIQLPTTFLAQVDSSVGGKTGVDLRAGKNLIGTFSQPHAVLIDPEVLTTLPERDFRAGLFESLKAGVICSNEVFTFMEANRDRILRREADALQWLIAESVRIKADVVGKDERESGLRRILNFGHTIGHALEAETDYKQFLHGEAVAWGMIASTMIAVGMQMASSLVAQRIISSILALAALPAVDVKPRNILKRLATDKKTIDGKVHFILPIDVGRVEIVSDVPERAILQSVEELRMMSHLA
jgi:3-dehydroquinate synthase